MTSTLLLALVLVVVLGAYLVVAILDPERFA
ncbi:MAG: K(+)-transporting ATPase subunit F [Planctomycetes bacterium]|nr:K(+)-transporting ATPase subunit F [Planctomycetota bacterium]MCC7171893.1 K(+)-transporting ATPase subunit F [Planctomycetota bacterium]